VIAFARHGQTALNREGRLQGRLDARLSAVGVEQANGLRAFFAAEPVTRVLSSPLLRATQTAAAIATAHDVTVEVDERLIELDYGEWDGLALRDVPTAAWAAWRADPSFAPPGGESLIDVTTRIAEFVDAVAGEDLVIAVSHVSPIKAAACLALGVDENASWRMLLGVASVTRVGLRDDGSHYLVSFNEQA
jgi:broad specificity phosphatase PhoE